MLISNFLIFLGKTEKLKDVEETDVWQKFVTTGKYRRQSSPIDDGDIDTLDKYSPEEMVPKFKPNNRFVKHRSLKIRDFDRGDAPRKRPSNTQSRHRVEDLVRKEAFGELHSDNFRESKHINLHEDSMQFTRRTTTARVIRRKPRDRFEKAPLDDDDPLADLGLSLGDSDIMKSSRLGDYRSDIEYRRGGGPRRPEDAPSFSDNDFHRSSGFQRRPPHQGETFRGREDSMEKPMASMKDNQEYNDYYDMKRVESIKNKLPGLLHVSSEGKFAIQVFKSSLRVDNYLMCIRNYCFNFLNIVLIYHNFMNFVRSSKICIYVYVTSYLLFRWIN